MDLGIVAAYLVGITVFGLQFSRRSKGEAKSLKSYFLADNTIPWWAIALSIVSAETSTLTIISIPGVAFAGDLGFLQVVLGYMLGRILVAALFLPRYFKGEMLTAYQLIDERFGHALHKVTAGLFLMTRAAAEGVRVFAISIVVGIAIDIGDVKAIALISALTLLYTFEGGMAAVIWTDVLQMGLYILGTVAAMWTLGLHVPGGWSHIHAVAAPLGKFHWLDFSFNLTKSYTFWAGVLGGTFLTMASHGTDQLMVQRMLAARNLRESRLALLSSGVVIFLQFTLFLLIGVGLFVFYGLHPHVFASADRIFPSFIVEEMPHGIAGLLIAAILAAAMSNLSAALNSLASTTVIDFYVPWRRWRGGEAQSNTLISRLATVFWAVVLFAIAVYSIKAGGKGHVVETGLSIASVAYGCLLGVFLLGTLTKYATQTGAILGMGCGFALNLFLWQGSFPMHVGSLMIPKIAFTWYVLIGAAVTFGLGSLFSLGARRPKRAPALLLLLGLMSVSARGQDFSAVTTLINTAVTQRKLPGAVVIVGHRGAPVFEKALGNRALEPATEAMTEDTLFDMASLSKVLSTTTAVLQLVEAKKVDLDVPVAKYLPDFAANGKDRITVRELMTHYSGLPEDVDLKDPWGLAKPDKAEGVKRAMEAVPYGPAGVTFKYSDINFITLGLIVEKVSGETLDVYAREHIFTPLGMTHTGYHPFAKTCGPARFVGANVEPGPKPVGKIGMVCLPGTWSPYGLDPDTAPTAHDDELNAQVNPDFDHVLRGMVHDPTTRRMGGVAGHAGVFSTAGDMAKFAQALLDKLTAGTGPFPLSQATLQMATSPNEPETASAAATIFTPDGQTTKGVASRGLGWDLNSAFSRPRGSVFPITTRQHAGSFGHTGFTGTSVWIDPGSDSYVVLLANAIHPRVGAAISGLRGQVATAAALALGLQAPASEARLRPIGYEMPRSAATPAKVRTGVDVLEATDFAALKTLGHGGVVKVGLLSNQSSLDGSGRRTIDVLAGAGTAIKLTTLFAPEHGLGARQDQEKLAAEQDAATHVPVVSVYGPKASDKHPKQADLKGLDAVVIDLQDAGVRFWTYETLTGYFLEACAKAKVPVVILDRPNPVGGVSAGGPVSDVGVENYTDFMPLPVRHGMTLGELAGYFNARATEVQLKPELLDARAVQMGPDTALPKPPATEPGLHADVTVVKMEGWARAMYWAETGLEWTPPSPNLKSPEAAVLYPGVGLTEQTNVSVGRGTERPFENLGSSWLKGDELAGYLTGRKIPGVAFSAATLTVAEDANKYPGHGQTIPAVHFTVTDRAALDSPELGVELLAALHHLYPKDFKLDGVKNLLASAATLAALKAGADPRDIAAAWAGPLGRFERERAPYLLYR